MLNQIFNSANYSFNPYALPVFFVAFSCLASGLFVFLKNRRQPANLSFFLLTFSAATWLSGMALGYLSQVENLAIFWYKALGYFSVAVLCPTSYLFTLAITKRLKGKRLFLAICYLIGFSFYLLNFKTDWIVSEVRKYFWGYYPIYGWLGIISIVFALSFAILSFREYFKALKKAKSPLEKTQIKYVFFGLAGAYIGATDFIQVFNIELYPFGYLPVFFFLAVIAYSIVRYRLMEIELIIRKALIYSALVTIVSAFFILLILLGQFFLQRILAINLWYFIIPTALMISLILPRLENYIATLTDKIFFRKRYDYQLAIREASQAITTILKLDDLLDFLKQTLLKTVRVKDFSLFVYQPTKGRFIEQLFEKEKEKKLKPIFIKESSSLIRYSQESKKPIILEEISYQITNQTVKEKEKLKELQEIKKQMEDLKITLVIPLFLKEKLTGLLNLGEKLSGEAFSTTDLELLTTLANQTAIALENAQVYEKERALSRLKSEFVSVAAHRLRTPLSIIKWALSLLRENLKSLSAEQRDLLARATLSNEKMIALVNNLLDVARIEEGQVVYHFTPTQLVDLIEEVLADFKQALEEKKIILSFKKPRQTLSLVKIDPERMKTVLQILIENAIIYSHSKGKIILTLQLNPQNKKEVLFSIEDTGIGIPKEAQVHIFDKFFRAKNALLMETEGTGLGLFIAKAIIEKHGGRIWFKSEEGKGTTFSFVIPG